MTAEQPSIRLPQDDYEPEGPEVEAWLAHRDRMVAALIDFDGRPPQGFLDEVGGGLP